MRAFVLLRRVELWDARVVDVLTVEPGTVVVELSPGVRLVGGRILRAGCELKDVFTVEKMLASEWAVEL